MDALTKTMQEHGEICETLLFFKKAMSVLNKEKTPGYIKDLNKFLQEYVAEHFQFEEEQIFAIVFTIGGLEERHLVRLLQHEHIDILDKLDMFKDLILKYGFYPKESQIRELVSLSKDIVAASIEHARHEDKDFLPILRKMGFQSRMVE